MKNGLKTTLSLVCLLMSLSFFTSCGSNLSSVSNDETSSSFEEPISPNSDVSSSTTLKTKDMYLSVTYLFPEDRDTAQISFEYGYLGAGLESIELPDNLLAGDYLKVTYTGKWTTTKDYPCTHSLDGTVVSYSFKDSGVYRMVNDGEYVTEESFSRFYLYDKVTYVITDEDLHYEKLSEAKYELLYYTLAAKKYDFFDDTGVILGIYTYCNRSYPSYN